MIRKPLQGVKNIVSFNWHFYVLVFFLWIIAFIFKSYFSDLIQLWINLGVYASIIVVAFSLLVSYYVYDHSNLYEFNFLNDIPKTANQKILNISAGFDETSPIIQSKFPDASLSICDFYDPLKHTEVSIKRARKLNPPSSETIKVNTNYLPFSENYFDQSFVIFSAHEIRSSKERVQFFSELKRVTKNEGEIYVLEHLRDIKNLIAYNLGFLHFYSRKTWLDTFYKANLRLDTETKLTPFISIFKLSGNGGAH